MALEGGCMQTWEWAALFCVARKLLVFVKGQ